ncbi:MAG: DNA topoisomerase 4 subunit A [bacterium]|nr:DNA topoisomerase 4 subunit A [bacterium]
MRTMLLVQDLETSYFNYATEVIVDRALPRVEDGLLPVQRRILYAMHMMGFTSYKKSARVVGEVLGKYHPHGDSSVYGSMVRLAQDFSMWIPLVDGQGNFGSIDGDAPAAMRYTEARLAAVTQMMLQDINHDAVDQVENFDNSLKEPTILPAVLPNLLINGASGIAVGMSTNVPPHNLGEVCDALVFMAQYWSQRQKITVDKLMEFIPGPDFPTGGLAYRYRVEAGSNGDGPDLIDTIRDTYTTGRGRIITQARVAIEKIGGGKHNIVITELPYAVQKSTLLDKIAKEVGNGHIEGVSDLRDESDYTGMRVVVEVSRGHNPRSVLDALLIYTQLRKTFGAINRALVLEEGETGPKLLSLHQILEYFISHRLTVISRRSRYELARREARLHLVEGLLRALNMIDRVITAIKKSRNQDTARTNLVRNFNFSQAQARSIVSMPLGRLASIEISALKKESQEVRARIKYLTRLLGSEKKRLKAVIEETEELKKKFTAPRRTVILDREDQAAGGAVVTTESDLVRPEGPQVVALTTRGIQRSNAKGFSYRVKAGLSSRVEAHLVQLRLTPEDSVILVSNRGRCWKAPVGRVPDKANFADLGLDKGEYIIGGGVSSSEKYLVIGGTQGNIKRTKVDNLTVSEASWASVIGLNETDEVLFAGVVSDEATVMFFTSGGKAIHFRVSTVNPQPTPSARGVAGIKLVKDDVLVAGAVVEPDDQARVVIVSETGYIKRVKLGDFPIKGRHTQGVQSLEITKSTGKVVAAAVARAGTRYCDLLSTKGQRQRLVIDKIPLANRRKRGEKLVELSETVRAVAI